MRLSQSEKPLKADGNNVRLQSVFWPMRRSKRVILTQPEASLILPKGDSSGFELTFTFKHTHVDISKT